MPLYEYQCLDCGHRFEQLQKFSDPPASTCPACGKHKVSQLLSAPAVQFKGTGWYVTDYAKKSGSGPGKTGDTSKSSDSTTSSESTKSDNAEKKTETKPAATSSSSDSGTSSKPS